jgi:hypothetical protein
LQSIFSEAHRLAIRDAVASRTTSLRNSVRRFREFPS